MPRLNKKKKQEDDDVEPWLLPFLSLMLLLLTVFVLLITYASFEDRRKIEMVMGAIQGTFGAGMGPGKVDVLDLMEIEGAVEPGPFDDDVGDLKQLMPLLWDDKRKDLNFLEKRFVQIFSINTELLYEPGETELSSEGIEVLDKVVPVLKDLEYPVLLAGHTSLVRDEFGAGWQALKDDVIINPTWRLSLDRALNVYRYIMEQGVDPEMVRLEAFGEFQPRYGTRTEANRRQNRRVEIVLDRRNPSWKHLEAEEAGRRVPDDPDQVEYRDFIFDL